MKTFQPSLTSGLTLIEVLVSLSMLLLLGSLITPSLLMSQKVNRDSKVEQDMAAYATTSMEIAKNGLLTKTASVTDPYPYLLSVTGANGRLNTLTYPTVPAGMTCSGPSTNEVKTYAIRGTTLGSRVTISIVCTPTGKSPIAFVEQVVRPQ